MPVVDVSPWPQWLERAALNERQKASLAITGRWYLSFCARGRGGVSHESARDFIAGAEHTQHPQSGQLDGRAGKELGDFSDYRRAPLRPQAPTWLSRAELQALLDRLEGRWRLMTQVAFGGGLRLMELLRLRVKDVDLGIKQVTVRSGKGDQDRVTMLPGG